MTDNSLEETHDTFIRMVRNIFAIKFECERGDLPIPSTGYFTERKSWRYQTTKDNS